MGKTSGKASVGKAILLAFIAALLLKIFIFDLMVTQGESMAPAIKPGAVLLVCRVYYGIRMPLSLSYIFRWGKPREGDVVVFYTPMGDIAVKRCREILPGDVFTVLGDNASHSYDSRSYGPVSNNNIIGRVLGIKK